MMNKQGKTLYRVLFMLLAIIICLQPLCAYAESGTGEEAYREGCAASDTVEETLPEPEESIAEEEQDWNLAQEQEPEVSAAEEVTEEADSNSAAEKPESQETREEEETTDEEITAFESGTACGPDAAADNDALFRAYFENLLMPKPRLRRPVGPLALADADLTTYQYSVAAAEAWTL